MYLFLKWILLCSLRTSETCSHLTFISKMLWLISQHPPRNGQTLVGQRILRGCKMESGATFRTPESLPLRIIMTLEDLCAVMILSFKFSHELEKLLGEKQWVGTLIISWVTSVNSTLQTLYILSGLDESKFIFSGSSPVSFHTKSWFSQTLLWTPWSLYIATRARRELVSSH